MAGNKERAIFFYRRYLSLSPSAPNRVEVEGRIAELEKEMKADEEKKRADEAARAEEEKRKADEARRLEEEKKKQGDEEPPVKPDAAATPATGTTGVAPDETVAAAPAGPRVPNIMLGLDVGTAMVGFGSDYESEVPAQATIQLRGAYRWRFGTWFADAGAILSFTTLPYYLPDAETKKSSRLLGFVAGGAFGYAQPKWNVRLELGAGVLGWGGLEQGNPFTAQFPEGDPRGMGGLAADGTLGMFDVRVALVPEYVIMDRLSAAMTIAFSSASAPDGMHTTVDGVRKVELLFGVGYAL